MVPKGHTSNQHGCKPETVYSRQIEDIDNTIKEIADPMKDVKMRKVLNVIIVITDSSTNTNCKSILTLSYAMWSAQGVEKKILIFKWTSIVFEEWQPTKS